MSLRQVRINPSQSTDSLQQPSSCPPWATLKGRLCVCFQSCTDVHDVHRAAHVRTRSGCIKHAPARNDGCDPVFPSRAAVVSFKNARLVLFCVS